MNRSERRQNQKKLGLHKQHREQRLALFAEVKQMQKDKVKYFKYYVRLFFKIFILGTANDMFIAFGDLFRSLFGSILELVVTFLNFAKWFLSTLFIIPLFIWFMIRSWIRICKIVKDGPDV